MYRTLPEPLHSVVKELGFFYCGEYRFLVCGRMGVIRFNETIGAWEMRLGDAVYELDIPKTPGRYEVLRITRDISEKVAYFIHDEMVKQQEER